MTKAAVQAAFEQPGAHFRKRRWHAIREWLFTTATDGDADWPGIFVGFSIGQGAATAAIASALSR